MGVKVREDKQTYTPGPSPFICHECDFDSSSKTWVIIGPPMMNYAFRREADARLLAAAPDLLEALKNMVIAWEQDRSAEAVARMIPVLREVIATAEV
jgi:hypothetical protein